MLIVIRTPSQLTNRTGHAPGHAARPSRRCRCCGRRGGFEATPFTAIGDLRGEGREGKGARGASGGAGGVSSSSNASSSASDGRCRPGAAAARALLAARLLRRDRRSGRQLLARRLGHVARRRAAHEEQERAAARAGAKEIPTGTGGARGGEPSPQTACLSRHLHGRSARARRVSVRAGVDLAGQPRTSPPTRPVDEMHLRCDQVHL